MEPFDDSKYKELMDGLECSEITLRNLERTVRIDAEFYKKENLNIVEKLKRTSFYPFTEFFTVSDGNHMSISENFIQDGVPYYRGQDIYHVFIEEADPVCIDEKIYEHPQMQRSHLHARDVLMSIVGAIVGNSAIVSANKKATCSCKLAIMRAKNNGILPEVLLVYIKTKYGQNQIQKFKRGTAQTGLLLEDFDQLYIPLFGDGFQQVILNVVNASKKSIITANKAYSDAEKMLLDSIGYYQEEKASVITVAKKSFLKSFAVTGRLDAEYYQPKYDEYLRKFDKFETTSITEEYEVFKNSGTNYADGVSDIGVIKTKQIGNDGINTDGIESYFDYDACILNKSTFLKNGDVVFASMGIGSLGKAGLFVTDKSSRYVTDSTLRIYRAKSTCRVRPEVLCIFLKSKIGQELIYRYVVGSTGMINIYDSDMEKIPIPILDDGTQKEIASKVQKHYKLCKQSKQLVQYAKQTVEIAIEQGEDVAIKWLKDKVKQTYADREKI